MGTFSFRSLFRKDTRGRRFSTESRPGSLSDEAQSALPVGLPVGRLVAFSGGRSDNAPLFEEMRDESGASPFAIVPPTRGLPLSGGRPIAERGGEAEAGFTADELCRLVPAAAVRAGAVPPHREIQLPLSVLRAAHARVSNCGCDASAS